jgi:hypothetical protein
MNMQSLQEALLVLKAEQQNITATTRAIAELLGGKVKNKWEGTLRARGYLGRVGIVSTRKSASWTPAKRRAAKERMQLYWAKLKSGTKKSHRGRPPGSKNKPMAMSAE